MRTFYKFMPMGRYLELASEFNKNLSSMICDSVPMAQLYHTSPVDEIVIGASQVLCTRQGMLTPLDT